MEEAAGDSAVTGKGTHDLELALNLPPEIAERLLAIVRRFEKSANTQPTEKVVAAGPEVQDLSKLGRGRRLTRGRRNQEAQLQQEDAEMQEEEREQKGMGHRKVLKDELQQLFGEHDLGAELEGARLTLSLLSDSESDDEVQPEQSAPKSPPPVPAPMLVSPRSRRVPKAAASNQGGDSGKKQGKRQKQ